MNKQIHPTLQKGPLATVISTLVSRTIDVGGIGTAYYDVDIGDVILIHGSGRDRPHHADGDVLGVVDAWAQNMNRDTLE